MATPSQQAQDGPSGSAATVVNTGAEQPSTVLAYPLPPLQYINSIDPDNLPQPPPPITEGEYYMFGQRISLDDAIIEPLEKGSNLKSPAKRLYPREYDHKKELKKINASILVNFLDLIDVLVQCPNHKMREEKCNDILTLFINFHHLINELRPHQARETLRVWLNAQRRTREEITKKLNIEMEKMTKVLDKYMEFEAAKKTSTQQQVESNPSHNLNNSTNNNQLASQTNTTSIDDIMCEIVDETCT